MPRLETAMFCLFWLLLGAGTSSAPALSAPAIKITEKEDLVSIRSEGATLNDVLRAIGKTTGIRFYLSPDLQNQVLTNEIEAPDWKTALRRLLHAYNRLELWDKSLNRSEVHILSGADDGDTEPLDNTGDNRLASRTPPSPSSKTPRVFLPRKNRTGQNLPQLNRDQLMVLSKGKLRDPFPESAFRDPAIKNFLDQMQVGPNSNSEAFLRARIKARRLLKVTPRE